MADRTKLNGRLSQWKFEQAQKLLTDDMPTHIKDATNALARMLGNCGWFTGDLATIVEAAVDQIGMSDELLAELYDQRFEGRCPICRDEFNDRKVICCNCLQRAIRRHKGFCNCQEGGTDG